MKGLETGAAQEAVENDDDAAIRARRVDVIEVEKRRGGARLGATLLSQRNQIHHGRHVTSFSTSDESEGIAVAVRRVGAMMELSQLRVHSHFRRKSSGGGREE